MSGISSLPPTSLRIQTCICIGLGPELYSATISFDPLILGNALIFNSFYFLFFHFIVQLFTTAYQFVLSLPWQRFRVFVTLFAPKLLTNLYFVSHFPFTTTTGHTNNRPGSYYNVKPTCNSDRFCWSCQYIMYWNPFGHFGGKKS